MPRSASPSTASTAAEEAPLLSDAGSGSDGTLRGSGAAWENGSDGWASAAAGMPSGNGLIGRVASMYRRAVRTNDQAREARDAERERGHTHHGDEGVTPVGPWRGFFICLSIWVLLFLQGASADRLSPTLLG